MTAARAVLLAAGLALALAGCATPATTPAAAPQAAASRAVVPATDKPAEDALAARLIARVNLYRSRHGLAPLRANAALARAATAHAHDMAANGKFSHLGSDGATLGARASRAGYRWQRIGENIAGGQATPEAVVDDWMASEGHRANILEPAYRDAGVGHVLRDPDRGRLRYRHYWVLMLGEPAED